MLMSCCKLRAILHSGVSDDPAPLWSMIEAGSGSHYGPLPLGMIDPRFDTGAVSNQLNSLLPEPLYMPGSNPSEPASILSVYLGPLCVV